VRLHSSTLQFTSDGRNLAALHPDHTEVFERRGQVRAFAVDGGGELAAFADQLWIVRRHELADGPAATLERRLLDGRTAGLDPIALAPEGTLVPALAGAPAAAWVGATATTLWFDDLGTLRDLELAAGALPFAGRRAVIARGGTVSLGAASWTLPAGAHVVAAAAVFDGAGIVLGVRRGAALELWCSSVAGEVQQRIVLPAARSVRLAARRAIAVAVDEESRASVIDLRLARVLGSVAFDADDLAIDPDGQLVALRGTGGVRVVELRTWLAEGRERVAAIVPDHAPEAELVAPELPAAVDAAPEVALPVPAAPRRRTLRIASLPPRTVPGIERGSALAQLDDELRLVLLRAVVAIADGWDTRRIGYPNESAHPHEHEVAAILGINAGFATEHVAVARRELVAHEGRLSTPERRGATTVLGALASDLELSPTAVDILLAIAAPTVWGEIARLYGILANDPGRPIVDEQLVSHVLGLPRHDVARELDPRSPLVRSGVVHVAAGPSRLFAALTVDPVVIARLRAEPPDLGGAVTVRGDGPTLDELDVPAATLDAALDDLARARAPLRVLMRGRRGAGRRTTVAAIATHVNRAVGVVDASLLPQGAELPRALRATLQRIHLAGLVPCICELDRVELGTGSSADVIAEVVRAHPGPLAVTLPPEAPAPFDPGHVAITLPLLDETERLALWNRELAAAGLWVRDAAGLAARYRVGAGVIRRAVAAARDASSGVGQDATVAIDAYIRQTRDARIGAIARRVERLASWSNLVLPPDVMDSLRELVARVRHRRRVFEEWGMSAVMSTSRGITALFSGLPGTGKTLVAGVIARELGLDLYQVDLSKVMSKWIGETERNLASVFDAAEDGQVVLLFDEADSLFAKRTEVRSSNDRYANLEVNYLLQRLDAFDGIAILTTNSVGSIDPAFKRRLSFNLSFPFPDEDTREQLWRHHLPPRLPVTGDLGLTRLARKYQLSGGYIRNACLRAAFLAAQDEMPLGAGHLERAITLEINEAGKLSTTGAIA
jgi:hypothetical protein